MAKYISLFYNEIPDKYDGKGWYVHTGVQDLGPFTLEEAEKVKRSYEEDLFDEPPVRR